MTSLAHMNVMFAVREKHGGIYCCTIPTWNVDIGLPRERNESTRRIIISAQGYLLLG
jgi:hypothetical protein